MPTADDGELRKLEERVSKLEVQGTVSQNARRAVLTADSEGFQNIATDAGVVLAVSLEGVEAYADGTRVKLEWGNPTAATLHDLKARVTYGPNENRQTKDVTLAVPLQAGRWQAQQTVLGRVRPDAIGSIEIDAVRIGSIRLYNSVSE